MAWSEIGYNPVPPADAKDRGDPTEVKTARWLRELANDIEQGRVNMFDLHMDAFQRIQGKINVVMPKNYLFVEKVGWDEPTKRQGK